MIFIKKTEDFKCERCGMFVAGDGFTNHCPECLWAKHVDNEPGDRESACGGMMEPIGYEKKNGEERIIHHCKLCGKVVPNRLAKGDNRVKILEL